ncbi:Type III restriction-modification system methylation subunit [Mycoplasmopsis gallinarum]|uniref:Type III restriction-modification system methylation subunit n=2 Tax=Mycoplasmopsis gallinarum TaxID=29557 RepID=A0A168RE69_9BACT|nr:Type III restriction-modification system methylation subunit [Mycoplasmopsis gallinarum]
MIRERLIKARTILKENGVIFVSIDDSEQAYLKVLMDEIFGEENFVTNIVWRNKNTGGGSNKNGIDIETEYILLYALNKKNVLFNTRDIDESRYIFEDKHFKTRGRYYLTDLDRVTSKNSFKYSESLDYEIKAPDGTYFKNYRNTIKPKSYAYTLGKELFDFSLENDFIEIQSKKSNDGQLYWRAYRKVYEKVLISKSNNSYEIIERKDGNNFNNIINDGKITTSSGKRLLISVLENKDFPFPKPMDLLKYLINLVSNKESRILDFFAGSGTTAHAVWDLNREDGGNRSVTIVTNNENNIAKNVTYERLHRISLGKATDGSSNFKWLDKNKPYENSLKVYETKQFPIDINESLDEKINLFIQEIADLADVHLDENEDKERILYYLKQLYSLKDNKEQNETN